MREHARRPRHQPALLEVARRTGGDDILPGGQPAPRAGDDVIEGQFLRRAAILALEAIAQEDVEAGEGGMARRLDVGFEADDRGKPHRIGRTSHRPVVFRQDRYPVEEYRLDGVLPGPKRQRVIAERPEVGVQNERWG